MFRGLTAVGGVHLLEVAHLPVAHAPRARETLRDDGLVGLHGLEAAVVVRALRVRLGQVEARRVRVVVRLSVRSEDGKYQSTGTVQG